MCGHDGMTGFRFLIFSADEALIQETDPAWMHKQAPRYLDCRSLQPTIQW